MEILYEKSESEEIRPDLSLIKFRLSESVGKPYMKIWPRDASELIKIVQRLVDNIFEALLRESLGARCSFLQSPHRLANLLTWGACAAGED